MIPTPQPSLSRMFGRSMAINLPLFLGAAAVIWYGTRTIHFAAQEADLRHCRRVFLRALAADSAIPVDSLLHFSRSIDPVKEALEALDDEDAEPAYLAALRTAVAQAL